MKPFIILAVIVIAVSCGKDNKSGKTPVNFIDSSPIVNQDDTVRSQFIDQARVILKEYGSEMNRYFRQNITTEISQRLRTENILISRAVLYNDRNVYTHSNNRNSLITLYSGDEYPKLSWVRYFGQKDPNTDMMILHELLVMVGIQDLNYQDSRNILQMERRHRN